jgi:hypothetical protein
MLFLTDVTFSAENKVAALKLAAEMAAKGTFVPPGMKLINAWSSLNGHKATMLVEVEDPSALMLLADSWDHLVDLNSTPVMQMDDVIKLTVQKYK